MEKRKEVRVTIPVRWLRNGGIPKELDHNRWRPGNALMQDEQSDHPDLVHSAKRKVDSIIGKMLSRGKRETGE